MSAALAVVLLMLSAAAPVSAAPPTPEAELLADALTRRAMALVQGVKAADQTRTEAASVLLELAAELTPDDAERQRLRAELAERTGDAEAYQQSLARYVALRPNDDAALLDLLLTRLGDTQTLDGRLASIEGVLSAGQRNERVSRPLRSRLAWLAAEAAQELGDRRRYVRWVKEAAKQDPANALAAETLFALVAELSDEPKTLGAAAKNWVEASPVDARARLALADILAGQAAYLDAAQQYSIAARFSEAGPLPWSSYRAWALCVGAAGDRQVALELIDSLENLTQSGVFGEAAAEQGLPLDLELVRLVLFDAAHPQRRFHGGAEGSDRVYKRVGEVLQDRAVDDPDAAVEWAWVQALFSPELAGVGDRIEALLADADPDDPRRRRALGWLALRQGDAESAREMFNAATGDPLAMLGLALLADDRSPDRPQLIRDVLRDAPLSLGALIAAQLNHRDNRPVTPTPEGVALLDLMQRTDSRVWRMDLDRDPWIELQARVRPLNAEPLSPMTLELSIRNASAVPVAVGPGQPLRLTALLNTGLFSQGQALGALPTQVVDASRRLTLQPGERITVPYRLDWTALGQFAAQDLAESFAYAVSASLDPRVRPDGGMSVGPLGIVDTVRGLQRRGATFDGGAADGWLEDLNRPGTENAARALALLVEASNESALGLEATQRFAEHLEALASNGEPAALAWAIHQLDAGAGGPDFQRLLDAARRSENDLVRVAHLLSQADRSGHPALDAAARTSLPRLRRFAEAWRGVLDQNADQVSVEVTLPDQP